MESAPKFVEILKVLARHEVELILVGGVAAIIEGAHVPVLKLETIIRSKEQANRDKDRATLPILRRTLRLKQEERGKEG